MYQGFTRAEMLGIRADPTPAVCVSMYYIRDPKQRKEHLQEPSKAPTQSVLAYPKTLF